MIRMSYNILRDSKKRFLFFTFLIAITLPFPVRFNSIAIVLLFINWLFIPNKIESFRQLSTNKFALILICFYLYHILELLNANDVREAFFDLEKKIAFIVLPLIFATTPSIDGHLTKRVLFYFSWSCVLAAIICLVNSFYYYGLGDSSYFFYHKLGSPLGIHAVYFSLYISASIFIQFQYLVDNWKTVSLSTKIITVVVILFFIGFLLLLSSKTIILAFFLAFSFFLVRLIFKSNGKLLGWVTSIASILLLFVFFTLMPNVRERFEEILFDEYRQDNPLFLDDYQGYHFTGGNIRLAIWKICLEVVNVRKAWIIGVGPGDVQNILTQTYVQKHVYPGDGISEGFLHYNAHNQFLQYYVSLGIIGLIFFIAILRFVIVKIILRRDIMTGCILAVFLSFCITESVLERQKGIVFFTLFALLIMAETGGNMSKKNDDNRNISIDA